MSAGHTPGPVTYQKCACGDPICSQYRLSTQGSVGFEIGDAQLYAAAPELLEAAYQMMAMLGIWEKASPNPEMRDAIAATRAAILKATGESSLRRVGG